MPKEANACFDEIVALVGKEDANAIETAIRKMDEYLVRVEPSQVSTKRRDLVARLKREGPNTPLMEQVIAALM